MNKTKKIIYVVALYVLVQLIADVTAFKLVEIWGIVIPAGSLVYAISFTARDLAHKQIGYKNTMLLIWVAAGANVVMALYFILTIYMPAPVWFPFGEEYALVLGIVPRIVTASILAELVSQLMDTFVYQKWWNAKPNAPQWTRVFVSNVIAIPIDSILFALVAFYGTYEFPQLVNLVLGQVIFKAILTVLTLPAIYLIPQNPEFSPQLSQR